MRSNFELLALAKLLRENDQELFLELQPGLFTGQYAQLFKLIQKSFSESHKIPNLTVLESIVNTKAPSSLRPTLNGILSAMEGADVSEVDAKVISRGLRDKQLLTTIDESIQELNQKALHKDVDGVRQVLNQIVESVNLDSVRPMDFSDAMEMPDDAKLIPSGIDGLDQYIVGFGGLTVLSGGSGAGKSIWLLQSAINQYLAGYNVLFVSLELSARVLGYRLKSQLTGIPFKKVSTDDLTAEERALIDATMANFRNRENVFRIITDPLDSSELLSTMAVERSLYNIDIVHLDYLNLVMSPPGSQGGWQNLADTAKALHRLSHTLGIVTVTASQVDLEKAPKAGKFPEIRVRGSAEIMFSATLLLFIYAPEADESGATGDDMVCYVLKNRNGPRCAILYEKKFSTMHVSHVCEV
jgi:replicative DNA helicase